MSLECEIEEAGASNGAKRSGRKVQLQKVTDIGSFGKGDDIKMGTQFIGNSSSDGKTSQLSEHWCGVRAHLRTVLKQGGTVLLLAGAVTSIVFVATKHVFCRHKSMLAETKATK